MSGFFVRGAMTMVWSILFVGIVRWPRCGMCCMWSVCWVVCLNSCVGWDCGRGSWFDMLVV